MRLEMKRLGTVCSLVLMGAVGALGQLYTGSITGTVKDPSGAVLTNAKVTITDAAKGFTYNAQTDNSGRFSVRNLPPSTYTERVVATGFTPFEKPNIVVGVSADVEADANLVVATGRADGNG